MLTIISGYYTRDNGNAIEILEGRAPRLLNQLSDRGNRERENDGRRLSGWLSLPALLVCVCVSRLPRARSDSASCSSLFLFHIIIYLKKVDFHYIFFQDQSQIFKTTRSYVGKM